MKVDRELPQIRRERLHVTPEGNHLRLDSPEASVNMVKAPIDVAEASVDIKAKRLEGVTVDHLVTAGDLIASGDVGPVERRHGLQYRVRDLGLGSGMIER